MGGKLYVFTRQGAEEVVQCLNAADGKEVWKFKYEAQAVTGAAAQHPGPRSSPAVAEGKVVTLGVGGVVTCLDAANGNKLWQKDEFPKQVPRFFTSYSPIIVDGLAIVHVGSSDNGAIIAFNLTSGEAKWKWTEEGVAYASPAVMTIDGKKQIVTLAAKSVVGIALADGKLLWKYGFPTTGMAYNAATPIIDGQTVIVTGQGRGTKALKIEKQGDGYNAKELWSNPQIATQFNTPVLKNGYLYGLSSGSTFFCINAQTGEKAWTDATRRGGRGFGTVLDAGSVLLALANNSELIAFKPNEKEYSEVAKVKVSEAETYAHPVIAGNNVFIKDQSNLTLMAIELAIQ